MSDEMALHVVYLDGVASSGEDEAVERTVPQGRPERQFVMASPEVGDSPGGLAVDSGGDMKVEDTAGETGPTASDERSPAASDGGIIFPPPAAELSTQGATSWPCLYDGCLHCFSSEHTLRQHHYLKHKVPCYECAVCDLSLQTPDRLVWHLRHCHPGVCRDEGALPHAADHAMADAGKQQCPICGNWYSGMKGDMQKHMRVHSGERPYKCSACTKSYTKASHLKIHFRTHTQEKPFKCDVCEKKFKSKQTLNSHLQSHATGSTYKCEECGKFYKNRNSLTSHKRDLHKNLKLLVCAECGYSVSRPHLLKTHMAVHTGERNYMCEECGQCFGHKNTLTQHMLTHTGEKKHVCEECGYSCAQATSLKRHMVTHTGLKAYSCPHCNRSFGLLSHLQRHRKRKHSCVE